MKNISDNRGMQNYFLYRQRGNTMRDAYIICMVIGFLLLGLSILGEFLENVSAALESFLNFDVNFELNFLPLSGVSICTGLIAFGGIGLLFSNVIAAAVIGYAAAMAIQTMIRRLKRVKNEAMNREELYLCDGKIINTVLPGGMGTVEFDNIKGISTTFVCKSKDSAEELKQNTQVKLSGFDGEVAIVRRKDEFSEYRDSGKE